MCPGSLRVAFRLVVKRIRPPRLAAIARRTTSAEQPTVSAVADADAILGMTAFCRELPLASPVLDFAVALVTRTHPTDAAAPPLVKQYVRYGSSPRGAQALRKP